MSYTEMEYDYAVEKGVPVLGFVREDAGSIATRFAEKSEQGRRRLERFRGKITSRTCRKYNTATELGMAVMKSLMSESRIRPRTGWIKADQARSDEDIARERELAEELKRALQRVEELEREMRDGAILGEEISRDDLAQGEDAVEFVVSYSNAEKTYVSDTVTSTWNDILRVIGPALYGYIFGKNTRTGTYSFHESLVEHLRSKIIGKVQSRRINLDASQVDACILHFKELGLLRFSETADESGGKFRGVTLTEEGERHLARLSARLKT